PRTGADLVGRGARGGGRAGRRPDRPPVRGRHGALAGRHGLGRTPGRRGRPVSGPAADALTPKAMVILQDRPVVAFTKWLADGLRLCSETRRGLQVVTGPDSRITVPLRLVLTGQNTHWVVRADGGYYDGLSGVPLVWDGSAF